MTAKDETRFTVLEHQYRERVGKNPRYKVVMENSDGDRLTKSSEDELLFKIYPLSSEVNITANKNQKTLDLTKD